MRGEAAKKPGIIDSAMSWPASSRRPFACTGNARSTWIGTGKSGLCVLARAPRVTFLRRTGSVSWASGQASRVGS